MTLGIVTSVLLYYTVSIYHTTARIKRIEGSATALYDDKTIWLKYRIFYDCYKRSLWWFSIPDILYAFAKGCVLAGLESHGFAQTINLIVIEALMLVFLIWYRPYERRSGSILNITLQVVRVVSLGSMLVFVYELCVTKTTQTILEFVLVIVQSIFTCIIALLLVVNGLIVCCKKNPHRKSRKTAGMSHLPLFTLV